jgi:hypothetical protein
MEPPPSPSSRSKSSFSGVFTLKTQSEANELARAVTTLVERGVNIFYELERGTSGEIEDTLKAVIRFVQFIPQKPKISRFHSIQSPSACARSALSCAVWSES